MSTLKICPRLFLSTLIYVYAYDASTVISLQRPNRRSTSDKGLFDVKCLSARDINRSALEPTIRRAFVHANREMETVNKASQYSWDLAA